MRFAFAIPTMVLIMCTMMMASSRATARTDKPAWQPRPADGPAVPTPTRIVDFGHDFLRDGDPYPVHQYNIHRWRLTENDGVSSAIAPPEIIHDVDVDGDGQTSDDSIAAYPLSFDQPLTPQAPWYDQQAGSPHFYGGIVFRFADQPNGRFTEAGINQDHDGPSHHPRDNWTLFYEIFDIHAGYTGQALYVWLKKDFLLGGDKHRVSFDDNSQLSLFLQRYYMGFEGCRWVVKNGDQFYISETVFRGAGPRRGSGHGKTHTIFPARQRWAEYNPQAPYDLAFEPDQAKYRSVDFDDVQAVGWYLYKDEMAPAYTGFKWYAFEATALVHRPERASEFIAMQPVTDTQAGPAFYASTTEVPYALWKRIYRRAASNAFATAPRGFSFDSDGDMGSMALLDGLHHLDEPVTNISVPDIAAWCNALSAFEMREPVYYIDPEFREPLTQVIYSRLIHNRIDLPKLYVKWQADGYRLPTAREWLAISSDHHAPAPTDVKRTVPVGQAAVNPRGFYGLAGNARQIVWTFGDEYDPRSNVPVYVMGGEQPLEPIVRPTDRPNRHPLAGFRLVRRDAGLDRPEPSGAAQTPAMTALPAPGSLEPDFAPPQVELARWNDQAAVGKYEVTFRLWRQVYRWAIENGYRFDRDGDMGSMDYWGFADNPATIEHHPDEPVTDITIYDAMVWCNALSEMHGMKPVYYTDDTFQQVYRKAERFRPFYMSLHEAQEASRRGDVDLSYRAALVHPAADPQARGFRLPTADEFESLVQQAGEYAWPGGAQAATEYAWFYDNSNGTTHRVGQLKPTPPGVYDICGNVSELTEPARRGPTGWSAGIHAARSGGSFFDLLQNTRILARQQPRGVGYPDLGMRVLLQNPPDNSRTEQQDLSLPVTLGQLALAASADQDQSRSQGAPLLQGRTFRGNQHRTGVVQTSSVTSMPRVTWRFDAGGPVRSSPVVVDGLVYVGSNAGRFYALAVEDGRKEWEIQTDGPVTGSATIVDDTVYFVSEAGTLYAVDRLTGSITFETRITDNRPAGTPAVIGDLVLIPTGTSGGSVQILMGAGPIVGVDRKTGQITWKGPAAAQGFAAPAVDDTTIYTALAVNQSGAIDLSSRRPRWQYWPGGQDRQWVNPILLENHVIVIGSITGSVNLLDRASGRRVWRQFLWPNQVAINNGGRPGYEILAAPAAAEGMIIVPGNDGAVYGFGAGSGERLWIYPANGPVHSAPMIAGQLAYFGDNSGMLHAVNIATGKAAWTLDLGARIGSSPWPTDHAIVVGTDAGQVVRISGAAQR
jgi:outer membrane protein assembly factor BamB/formylglycine-generating enzyme required for sulfatase activity